jgi:hypothetical protein
MTAGSTLVLDIETLGDIQAEHAPALAEMAAANGRDMAPEEFAALSPPLARVVCVGFRRLEDKKDLAVWDRGAFAEVKEDPGEPHKGELGELQLLETVNRILGAKGVDRVVTFNGRAFDLPVLVHRMVSWEIRPCGFLLAAARQPRYKGAGLHVDLREQFTFQGATNGPGTSLRAFALGYGLDDPKAGGDGSKVAHLVENGDAAGLVRYCLSDVATTADLYERWSRLCGVA